MIQKVRLAYLQSPVTIPGIVTTITTLSPEKTPGISLALHENGGLLITAKGITAYVPAANVKVALLDSDKETTQRPFKRLTE